MSSIDDRIGIWDKDRLTKKMTYMTTSPMEMVNCSVSYIRDSFNIGEKLQSMYVTNEEKTLFSFVFLQTNSSIEYNGRIIGIRINAEESITFKLIL